MISSLPTFSQFLLPPFLIDHPPVDLWIHQPSGIVYLACASQEGRTLWAPYFLTFKQPSRNDYVAFYDPSDSSVTRLELEGLNDPRGLNLHGMDVVASQSDPESLFISLVNHRPQPARMCPPSVSEYLSKELHLDPNKANVAMYFLTLRKRGRTWR